MKESEFGLIVGNGDIASVLEPREGICYFASGVSNSQETRESEYQREKDLLDRQDRSLRLVYISSLCVLNTQGRYADHKREMEQLVKQFPQYCIVRIGNISWGNNPHTLINTLRNNLEDGRPLEIRDVYRYIVELDEFLYWIGQVPDFNCEINIPGKRMKVSEIVKEYVL